VPAPDRETKTVIDSSGIAKGGLDNLVVKIAELCNLNCRYCYLYNHVDTTFRGRPKFMSDETYIFLLDRIRAYCEARPGHRMSITFHGGEPTLVGGEKMRWLSGQAHSILGNHLASLQMQTNATLIDDDWIAALIAGRVHASVSLDGPSTVHDRERVDHAGRGSHADAIRGLRLLQEAKLQPGVIAVVAPGEDGAAVYHHFRDLGLTSIDFLLPDITWDSRHHWYGDRGTRPVARYLISAFDAWFDEDNPDVKVRIFYGLLSRMMGGEMINDAFGNPRQGYLIIETDGSIEPLDALRVCKDGITVSNANVRTHGFDDLATAAPLAHRLTTEAVPLSRTCCECAEVDICGGGYLPHRYSADRGFDNPSAWCEDILEILAHIRLRTGLPPRVPESLALPKEYSLHEREG
jgi:uncharacterized protein